MQRPGETSSFRLHDLPLISWRPIEADSARMMARPPNTIGSGPDPCVGESRSPAVTLLPGFVRGTRGGSAERAVADATASGSESAAGQAGRVQDELAAAAGGAGFTRALSLVRGAGRGGATPGVCADVGIASTILGGSFAGATPCATGSTTGSLWGEAGSSGQPPRSRRHTYDASCRPRTAA